ncbi:Hypothetical protein AA314_04642 [Archangium gephyra]|uniref:Uncharacterized protein n=1 Tax=Archangium gephyra TaxID=48 RepID=A0AAC8TFX2_9BACT|nr:Hypothetical protein AA314_04642 [Archangium gephyra]
MDCDKGKPRACSKSGWIAQGAAKFMGPGVRARGKPVHSG